MTDTAIQWTDKTWNPVTGCTKVSQGCKNCYAERLFPRPYPGRAFTDVRTHPERLDQPLHWRKPQRIFVNSMSDLFHEDVPDGFIAQVFDVMETAQQHTFQILTKRPERMRDWCLRPVGRSRYSWPLPNVHLGVSVEDQDTANERIPLLLRTPAAVRFISAEPLLGPIELHSIAPPNFGDGNAYAGLDALSPHNRVLRGVLDWIIVGGESGPKARSFDIRWARDIIAQCRAAGVACFMKQTGANVRVPRADCIQFAAKGSWRADSPGSDYGTAKPYDRSGGNPDEWPVDLRVRQFPEMRA